MLSTGYQLKVVTFKNFVDFSKLVIFRSAAYSVSEDGKIANFFPILRFQRDIAEKLRKKICNENVVSDFEYFFHDRRYSPKRYSAQGRTFRSRLRGHPMG